MAAPQAQSPPASRALPHNLDAERGVLSSMLLDESALLVALERLHADQFYHPPHRLIFDAMRSMSAAAETVTPTTLAERLDRQSQLEQAGGVFYLGDIAQAVSTSTQVTSYVDIVRHRATLRSLIQTSSEIAERAQTSMEDASSVVAWAEQRIFELSGHQEVRGFRPIGEHVGPVIRKVMAAADQSGSLTGVPSGFRDLDEKTNGFQTSDLIIVAARPGVGKTSIALNIAANAAFRGSGVAIFSLEMAAQQLAERILCSRARVNLKRLRDGFLTRTESTELIRVASEMGDLPLYVDDTTYLSPSDIASRIRHLKARHPEVRLVIIDYLQLMHGDRKRESRQVEVSDISRSMKLMARDFELPVIALAQLSRAVESRSDGTGGRKKVAAPRPKLSDLRESGSIEQDADLVIFLHRELRHDDEEMIEEAPENLRNTIRYKHELVIEKHRNGPTGICPIHFQAEFTRFDDLSIREFDDQHPEDVHSDSGDGIPSDMDTPF